MKKGMLLSALIVAAFTLIIVPVGHADELPAKLAAYDADKDGKVSKDEMVSAAKEKAKTRAEKRFTKADANSDGFISEDESKSKKTRITDADTDKDGKVSKEEFISARQQKAEKSSLKRFQKNDKNGDGFITSDETGMRKKKQETKEVDSDGDDEE